MGRQAPGRCGAEGWWEVSDDEDPQAMGCLHSYIQTAARGVVRCRHCGEYTSDVEARQLREAMETVLKEWNGEKR